ncbi:MAG: AMP-binding protein [Pseudomonadota bacterium]
MDDNANARGAGAEAGDGPNAAFLAARPANFQPITPLGQLARAAATYPARAALAYGADTTDYATLYARARRLASAVAAAGVARGEVVSALLFNTPPLVEAHFGVPMAGAVLNAINTRLSADEIAYILDHGPARLVLVDAALSPLLDAALARMAGPRPTVIEYADPVEGLSPTGIGPDYEAFLAGGDPTYAWTGPADEWDAITLNYTSGTTGRPKGVLYHHRGAALLAEGNLTHARLAAPPVYLWTLPMFHCNGWCFPWSVVLAGGLQVCLRQVRADAIWDAIARHRVTLMCGAPVVMATVLERRPAAPPTWTVHFWTAAAPPSETILAEMAEAGFAVTHVYGLTEVYGPAVICDWHPEWSALPVAEQARLKARQGVRYAALEALAVLDPATLAPVPADGQTLGEVMMRGNVVMKGYHRDPEATARAFEGGWFRTGDLAVMHADGYLQLRDRAKDIIISGGENVSSIEVENALMTHPAVALAAVVGAPHPRWGETPVAFVELRPGMSADEAALIDHVRGLLARFKAPSRVIEATLPRTSTGKIQKTVLRDGLDED